MVKKGKPATKAELVDAIQGLTYDLNMLNTTELRKVYKTLLAASK